MKQEAYEPHHSPKHLFVHHSFSKCLSIKLFKSTVKLSYIPKLDNTLNKLHKEAYFFLDIISYELGNLIILGLNILKKTKLLNEQFIII